jgi:hypothetical protein
MTGNGLDSRGAGPATSAPPELSALRDKLKASAIELIGRMPCASSEDHSYEEFAEISAEFARKLSGLRRLPRHARASALRAAREWRAASIKVLRDRQAAAHSARKALWRLMAPQNRPNNPSL